ncbi:ArsR/SmtB family transcription factor [Pseudonocardia sp. CA-107938]|uniref:ArsR/SmtB family transcription factor n=1 Tax=Pseudonocardia sp. CA-107938 TaxID=3240021 RepID=UPI003D92F4DE
MGDYTKLDLGEISGGETTIVPHLGASLLSIVADALGGRPQGVNPSWRRSVRSAVPAGSSRLMHPLVGPGIALMPDCLTLTSSMTAESVTDQLEEMRETAPTRLVEEVETDFDGAPPEPWWPVLRDPDGFVSSYADVLGSAWRVLAPVMRRAEPLFEREERRIRLAGREIAAALAVAAPRLRGNGTWLHVPDPFPLVCARGDRPLVLVPLVSGSSASIYSVDRSDVVWVGYPLPGLAGFAAGTPIALDPPDPLQTVLGATRAAVLRAAAGQPLGVLARACGCSLATLTHHCDHLERAGLVVRERVGQRVLLHRTARGDGLIELLSD